MKITKQKQKGRAMKKSVKRQLLQSSASETDLEDKPKYDSSSDSSWNEVQNDIDNWYCFIFGENEVMDMRLRFLW